MDIDFKTLLAKAQWYKNLELWIVPYGENGSWKNWKYIKQSEYDVQFENYEWNNVKGINVLVGKKG